MKLRQRLLGDGIFAILTCTSIAYGVFQFLGLLKKTEGVNVSWLLLWQLFMTLCIWFANDAYTVARNLVSSPEKEKKLRESWQLRTGYILGWICNGINLTYLLFHLKVFDGIDIVNFAFVGGALLFVLAYHHRDLKSPMARACYAVLCKAIPQLFMFWRIGPQHITPAGFKPVIWFGHTLIILRLAKGHLSYAAKHEEGTRGALFAEWWNLVSWLLVTYAYYLY